MNQQGVPGTNRFLVWRTRSRRHVALPRPAVRREESSDGHTDNPTAPLQWERPHITTSQSLSGLPQTSLLGQEQQDCSTATCDWADRSVVFLSPPSGWEEPSGINKVHLSLSGCYKPVFTLTRASQCLFRELPKRASPWSLHWLIG